MCLLPQRNPVYTAKEVATVDWLSGGRVDLGVGVGWLREEFEAVEVPWERRGDRTDEYLQVLHALWCEDPSSFTGTHYTLPPCNLHPKPVQDPHPPSTSAVRARPPCDARPAPVRVGTPSTAPRLTCPTPLATLDALLDEQGRTARPSITVTVCPYFKPSTRSSPSNTPRRAPTRSRRCSSPCPPKTSRLLSRHLDPCLERAKAC